LVYCSPPTGFREKVEAYNILIALEGLDIGHRVVLVALCGTVQLAGRIDLSYLEPGQVGMLRLLESDPIGKIDSRRPLDRLDRGKALQQILGQMVKVSPRKRRRTAEGSLQLLEEDFLLCKPSMYLIFDLLGEEAEFQ